VAGCAEKLIVLQRHLSDKKPLPHTLFYCGTSTVDYEGDDVRQVEALSIMLNQLGWKTSRITADESLSTREHLLDMFSRKEIDGLISIKVLDEGIDIPACEGAYLLASQASDRQGIQRRGRVLRKSEGKEIAYLYDFLVLGGSNSSRSMINLAKRELRRAYNFSKDSVNFNVLEPELIELAKQFGFSLEVENE
jgi:superfamily II DNA or RNA helicase